MRRGSPPAARTALPTVARSRVTRRAARIVRFWNRSRRLAQVESESIAMREMHKGFPNSVRVTWIWAVLAVAGGLGASLPAAAQQENAAAAADMKNMTDMPDMTMPGMSDMPNMNAAHAGHIDHGGSGTAWEPQSDTSHEWMIARGGWDLMAHGVVFVDYNQSGGPRGAGKAESMNWAMLMEQHGFAGGTILFRQMLSAEPLTAPHPGFPELFQTGETYRGEPLVDHQHPHNVFGELAAYFQRPLGHGVALELYGGPVGEPAIGPVTFMHRASAAELPMAPLSHHLQDSTHISFGVATAGLVVKKLRLEACAFNGREPGEQRWEIQPAALDSWSGRASLRPSRNWTAQYSIGRLEHPEALEPGSQWRETASAEYTRPIENGNWASSLVWGRVHKLATDTRLNSYLFESTLNFREKNYAFTRLELVDKDELFPQAVVHPAYRIGASTFGGVRDIVHSQSWQGGIGADLTFYSKPAVLDAAYGEHPVSFQVFIRIRPGTGERSH